jgi:uncharacterized protein
MLAHEQPEKDREAVSQFGVFSTDNALRSPNREKEWQAILDHLEQSQPRMTNDAGVAMDAFPATKYEFNYNNTVPNNLMLWYGSQSFIGYQLCALMAQHWLVSKACVMPAKDAVRNGYEVTVNDGTDVDPALLDAIRKADVKYRINKNLIEFVQMGRVFGIRIAVFKVETDNPIEYYYNPFNIDAVKPGTYKGICQVDPYWITPQLSNQAAGDPFSEEFYEPTWWRINGILVHKSHMVIFRTEELADILKPTYIYGSVSIPQKIYERVYAAERTANEGPMLALSKRTDVVNADMTQAVANQGTFEQRMQLWAYNRDNYGIKTLGLEESMQQFDTSLADLDAVIMTQYQLVAAIANVPATKLLGTQPKGFNTTGEFEEANYHEELESIQTHDLTPMLERHHQLLIKSEIQPNKPFEVTINWNALDALTKREQAELNKFKAETGQILMTTGAIDGQDERARIITDVDSGYSGLIDENTDDNDDVVITDPENG